MLLCNWAIEHQTNIRNRLSVNCELFGIISTYLSHEHIHILQDKKWKGGNILRRYCTYIWGVNWRELAKLKLGAPRQTNCPLAEQRCCSSVLKVGRPWRLLAMVPQWIYIKPSKGLFKNSERWAASYTDPLIWQKRNKRPQKKIPKWRRICCQKWRLLWRKDWLC